MRLVVDSDGGIDDAAAIAWLAARPDVELAAVTAVGGNCGVEQAARNLRVVLEAVGAGDVPVFLGGDPADPAPPLARPVMIHGHDGLGDCGLPDPAAAADRSTPAVDVLRRELRRGSAVLTLGPMTNLALAVVGDPDAAAQSAGLVLMGGSARAGGNARPVAEANVAHDPLAAARCLAAPWPVPPVMVGLDVTHRATLREDEFALLAERRTPAAALLDGPLSFYRRRAGAFCAPGETPCHDLLAAMAAVTAAKEPIVGAEVVPVGVDTTGGPAWGMTVADLRVLAWRAAGVPDGNLPADGFSPVAVALEVDVERFRSELRALAGG